MATDYKALLMAYMDHVVDIEGVHYIQLSGVGGPGLTQDQRRDLMEIWRELEAAEADPT